MIIIFVKWKNYVSKSTMYNKLEIICDLSLYNLWGGAALSWAQSPTLSRVSQLLAKIVITTFAIDSFLFSVLLQIIYTYIHILYEYIHIYKYV